MRLNRDNHPIVAVGDIHDAYGFVARQVMRAPGVPVIHDPDEAEELINEGVVILLELHDRFEPHRPGYDQPGRFSGYAAWALPKRLQSAWRRMHPEHLTRKLADGKRTVEYGERPLSVDFRSRARTDPDISGQRMTGCDIEAWTTATSCLPGQTRTDTIDQAITTTTASAPHASAVVYHLSCERAITDTEIARRLTVEGVDIRRHDVTRTRELLAIAIRHHQAQAA